MKFKDVELMQTFYHKSPLREVWVQWKKTSSKHALETFEGEPMGPQMIFLPGEEVKVEEGAPDKSVTKLFNAGQAWTVNQKECLLLEYNKGHDLQAICLVMGRTASGVVSQLQNMGLLMAGKNWTYHKVDPDPWVLTNDVRNIDKFMKEKP